uniref:Uncharacterized protein n=1 Tax=Salix viminalis TaxID=40686 RepID=A0A6N2N8Y6_SALVM
MQNGSRVIFLWECHDLVASGQLWTADPNGCDGKSITEDNIRRTNACRIVAIQLKDGTMSQDRPQQCPNTLILFEEIGGNPSNVSFQLQATETICGNAYEGTTLELSCNVDEEPSQISNSLWNPQGSTCAHSERQR